MEEVDSSFNTSSQFDNSAYITPTALQLRLDTTQLIENIEMFLAGRKIVTQEDQLGNIKATKVTVGKPKANDHGIQAILNYIQCIINPSVVQGNFPTEKRGYSRMYESYIEEMNIELAAHIMVNLNNWDIDDDDYDVIVDFITKLIIPFMTRLIDNKEREGYGQSLQTRDNTVHNPAQQKGSLLSKVFNKGGL